MKLTNFGGATAILEHKGKRIFFDPWLDDGIFHGAWYHYPPLADNAHIPDIGHVDYVYISHIHEDHCSAGTIEHLNRDAEIILMDRPPNFVKKFLDSHGFKFKKVHLLKEREPYELEPGLTVEIIEADPSNELVYVIDSGLMIRWDDFTVYNSNDCRPYAGGLEYIRQQYPKLDLALIPYTCGAAYPACYNLPDEVIEQEKQRLFTLGAKTFTDTIQALTPRYVMPFADQYVVGGSRWQINERMPHPPSPGAAKEPFEAAGTDSELLLLNSGQAFDFDAQRKIPETPFYQHTEEDRRQYVESLKDRPYDHEKIEINPAVSIERLVVHARNRLWESQTRMKEFPEFSLYLDVQDRKRRWHIPLDRNEVNEVAWDAPLEEPRLRMGCDSTLMVFMLLGHVSWNIADAALFLDYERVPNVYRPEIYVLQNLLKL